MEAKYVLTLAAFFGGYILKRVLVSRNHPLPPGPSRWPLIGSILSIPVNYGWLIFSEWEKKYGPLIYLDALGQPMVVINSAKVARDLLDKRSSIYSDRPHLIMGGDLVGYDRTFVLQPYGEIWRKQRKMVAADFSQSTVPRYWNLQETQARKMICNILADPSTLVRQIKLRIATIIIRVTYGYYIKSEQDPFFTSPMTAMENFSQAAAPGSWIVDFIPQLKNLPSWMPGAGFLETAKVWRNIVTEATWSPYLWCKKNTELGTALTPSLCGSVVSEANGEPSKEEEELLVWAASAVMGGGMDTNMSTALTFFMAMILHPDIQEKARAEIDSVVGLDRLPSIADRDSLPYVNSVITEVFRWQPAKPMGIAHALSQDDVYEGYHLPKGTLCLPNVWQVLHMLHDPEVYPEPMKFSPERYGGSQAEMSKVTDLAFGFGRRVCPGFHFAEGTIFAIVTTVLATCEILPAVDASGKTIMPEIAYTSGTIVFPKAYKCNLKARSSQAVAMLTQGAISSE
ncbi:putative monooxygenase [Serpula lacrymans var. lacrymans S7.9]|uniref:Putative monooxygenase n=1 Tax=Serpula lacrymans var. lacrymans (strain S7.9) TaxID=578457 RepID=F8PCM4_SERL9|nr:putative monooxygenase [Serpula lacrymans var. lacrymans S7.9]EGO19149.1 putative monooxygenase [Serpula lacrymans var. lacrymans S7.9]